MRSIEFSNAYESDGIIVSSLNDELYVYRGNKSKKNRRYGRLEISRY